jgi:hypothetical protein
MADVFYTNLVPTLNTPWWSLWKLTRAMVEAGYQIKACGDGTNFKIAGVSGVADPIAYGSADDLWTTIPGTSSWICLRNPSLGFDIVFWRNTTSTSSGKIIIGKQGAFVTAGFPSASATSPGTIPSGVGYFRGSAATFTNWFGAAATPIGKAQIGVRDVVGSEAGAFFFAGSTPTYGANTWGQYIQFTKLDPYSPEQGNDPEPYVFLGPSSATGEYGSYTFNNNSLNSDLSAGTNGYWWGYNYAGNWTQYGGGYIWVGGLDTSPIDPYSSGTKYFLDPYVIFKVQTGLTERKGITKSIRYSPTAIAQYDTIKNLAYAKLSSTSFNDGVIFWDGITATPSQ